MVKKARLGTRVLLLRSLVRKERCYACFDVDSSGRVECLKCGRLFVTYTRKAHLDAHLRTGSHYDSVR